MQLHRLRLTAIGPFADPVEIDLDKLSASGIFLLEGPTGAGKSTLIDAIVFALYGEVAARSSSNDRIASAVAADGVTPSVELDFSTSHGMFRIRRTPKHARRKRRGSGMTVENASGALWRLLSADDGAIGEPVATRLDEIGAEVVDIVGLSREQFVQTVVLPQGEFATFLRADAEHRRALLQKLFGTEIYDRTVERLVDLRRTAYQQRAAAQTSVLGSVSAYCGAAGLGRDDEDALVERLEGDPDGCLAVIQQQLDSQTAAEVAARHACDERSTAAEAARSAFTELTRRETARGRVLELRERLATLDADASAQAADTERVARAGEAAGLVTAVTGLEQARARAAEARSWLEQRSAALPDHSSPPDQWSTRERQCRDQAASLAALIEVEAGLTQARQHLDELQAECEVVGRRCADLAEAVSQAPAAVAAMRSALESARIASATLPDARAQLETAKSMVRSVGELVTLVQAVDQAFAECADAAATARRLVRGEAELRLAFIDGMAGHLAAQLEPDQPCPVCGSRQHPEPAAVSEPVDRADVDRAAGEAAGATRQLEAARLQLTALEAAAAELRGVVRGRTPDQAQRELDDAESRVAAAEAAEDDVVRLQRALVDAERALDEQRAELRAAEAARSTLDATRAAVQASVARDEARVAAELDGYPSLAQRAEALTREATAWGEAIEASNRTRAADDDVAVRASEVDTALSSSSFSSVDEVRAAHLEPTELRRLQAMVDSRQAAREAVEAELRLPELVGVDVAEAVDLEAARLALQAAEAAGNQAQALLAQVSHRLSESTERAHEVQGSISAQRAVLDSTAATIRMADLASASTSDNAKAMSLPTFVLRERFVDVVASANQRLATMSEGRYRLEHVEDRRGNRKSGLDLQVRDAHIELPRDPATLSGGESFYCSLALALGLADVVTAEAGGVDLGTLFVDEGFGSLDADTLEQVLVVLQGLASSGRVVGIVSHVPELKEQVAERISVVPMGDGSSRLVVAA